MEKPPYPRFVIVKDNFYDNPLKVYEAAKVARYYEPAYYTGLRSREVYHEKGVKEKLEKILNIKITRWDINPKLENGVFYSASAKGKNKEIPGIHSDTPYDDITCVVYLTPNLPLNCGTSLWMHKQTQLTDPPTATDARQLKMKIADLRNQLEEETRQHGMWLEIDRIGYRFNRMVAYPSGVFHSATNHFGSDINDVRLYQTFRIGVNWSTFGMAKL